MMPRVSPKKKLMYFKKNYDAYLMLLPTVLFAIVFCYVPMYGVLLAFKKFMFYFYRRDV